MTIHMGDVYFVSTPEQFDTNLLDKARDTYQQGVAFPKVGGAARGRLRDLPAHGQPRADQRLQGAVRKRFLLHWPENHLRRVAERQLARGLSRHWPALLQDGDPSDKRGILLLSHHQPYDAFSASYMGAANQLNKILPQGKQVVWLFGHNHALALYKKMQLDGTDFVIYPRLIGIGGFPNILESPKSISGIVAYDQRTFQEIPDLSGISQHIGFNGYAKIVISGNTMEVQYLTNDCIDNNCTKGLSSSNATMVAAETFVADLTTGNVDQTSMYVGSELVKVNEPADEVSSVSCIPAEALAGYNTSLHHLD